MKAAFFHDHKFIKNSDNNYYTLGKLPYKVWMRYLKVFNELVIVSRCQNDLNYSTDDLSISSGPNVTFVTVNKFSLKTYKELRIKIKQVLLNTDCSIIRMPSVIGIIACVETIKMKKPWAVEVVACAWDALWNHGGVLDKLIAPFMFIASRYFIYKAPYAIYVSNEFLQKRYPNRGKTQSCSNVQVNKTSPHVLEERIKKIRTGWERRTIQFGVIGSLNINYKGHETALRALSQVKNVLPNFCIQFLGEGESGRWIKITDELGITKNVKFCGTLPAGEAVLKWMDGLDIFLIPSLQEGLPRALVEAMSRGCPSLGARTGGIPELIYKDCIHRPKDYHELAKLIVKMVCDLEWMERCASENFYKSQEYIAEVLDERRDKFWTEVKAFAIDSKCESI